MQIPNPTGRQQQQQQQTGGLGKLGQLGVNMIANFMSVTNKRNTSTSNQPPPVRSTIGYQRWSSRDDAEAAGKGDAAESVDLEFTEQDHLSTTNDEGDELSSNEDNEVERPEQYESVDEQDKDHQPPDTLQEPPSLKVDTITEYQAGWNVTNAIQGMFIVSFPYTVQQGGYWSLIAMVLVAHICCHTGKILVDCLYEEGKDGQMVRVRTSYGDIAQKVFGDRFGRPIINIAQVIELLMTCILYVLLSGELLQGTFNTKSMPLSAWISISIIPLLMCAFIKTMRRVSWLSLWCSVAHLLINIIILIYCFMLTKQWKPGAVKIKPDPGTVPIALGIIVFSYTSQIFLPTLEGRMIQRNRFRRMLNWTHVAAAVFKAVFSYVGYITWGENTQEVITNNLPAGLRSVVNVILVIKALLSYPLPYFAAVEIIEDVFFQDQSRTIFPSCYVDTNSMKWWGIMLRMLLVLVTMLMAIFIPHFAILMGLIGSFTGTMLSFVWPCVFHLNLKRDKLTWYQKLADVIIIILGMLCCVIGIYSSSRALLKALKVHIPIPLDRLSEKAANETLKSSLLG